VEAYDKRYGDLAQLTRDNGVRGGGVGRARGVDAFAKWPGVAGIETRTTYSFVRAERTDPLTGVVARAPFDVTHAVTTVVERRFRAGVRAAVAWRSATGRPHTAALGGTLDSTTAVWTPVWGAPYGERLPAFRRLDVSASRAHALGEHRMLVSYVSLVNVLDRRNVQGWRYSADYGARQPVRSIFNRSVYFGATLSNR
jgi:hypothetical protein